jgi:hypothetical protein
MVSENRLCMTGFQKRKAMSDQTDPQNDPLALGTWIGREQAFKALASHCSAARVACLKQVRDTSAYKSLNLTWEEFCTQYADIGRVQADRLIRQLGEFGAPYFQLSDIVPVSPAAYREIAPAIADGCIEFLGEQIPITPENSAKIKAAVNTLRKEIDLARPEVYSRTLPSIMGVQVRFDVCFADMEKLLIRSHDALDKASLRGLLSYCGAKLAKLKSLQG